MPKSISNPKTARAFKQWYSFTPKERYAVMQKVNSQKKTTRGKFHDCINYLEKNEGKKK